MEKYDISIENGVFIATNQNGIIAKQFHNVADCYVYESTERLKVVEKYGDDLTLSVENVVNISGVPFVGDFDALKTAITDLIDSINNPVVTVATDPTAAKLAEQQLQTAELIEIKNNLNTIVNNESILPTGNGLQSYSPTIANEAQLVDIAATDRKSFIFQVFNGDCYLRFSDETTNPASRTEKTILLKDGQSFSSDSSADGSNYLGAISAINTQDGNTFDFVYIKFN